MMHTDQHKPSGYDPQIGDRVRILVGHQAGTTGTIERDRKTGANHFVQHVCVLLDDPEYGANERQAYWPGELEKINAAPGSA